MTMHLSYRHSIPVFDEQSSRRHESKPLWKLQLESLISRRRNFDPKRIECFAQFLGFPRSGHSLIGALIDAHPDARISHELDAMGLYRAGMGFPSIARLIDSNSRSFATNGKWWNGYSYAIDLPAYEDRQPLVIGDKKGDWAVRWCAKTPGLLQSFLQSGIPQPRWLLVVRAPEDNIATMTLRRGGLYDRLRIKASAEGVSASESIAQAQADGKLPAAVSDEMVSDYRQLCEGITAMQELIPRDQWLMVDYDAFTAAPSDGLKEIAAFLGLDPDSDWLAAASAAVHPPGKSRTRTRLKWSDAQNQAVAELKTQFSFLAR